MSKNKWVRSISFNRTNKEDIARLELIGNKSFSRFIKQLLDDELSRQAAPPQQTAIKVRSRGKTIIGNTPPPSPLIRGDIR